VTHDFARARTGIKPKVEPNKTLEAAGPSKQPMSSNNTLTRRSVYLTLLTWTFTAFNSVRVLGYLPTVLAIIESGNSSQHSLLTWITWLGANSTMAAWLYEHNGRRLNKAVVVNIGNSTMCLATTLVIVYFRV